MKFAMVLLLPMAALAARVAEFPTPPTCVPPFAESTTYGCLLTHQEEPMTEPLYGDYGHIMQATLMVGAQGIIDQATTHLGFTRYRNFYPNLSPEGKDHFQTRCRAIFGKDFEMPSH